MQQTGKPASKTRIVVMWLIFLANIVFWMWLGFWRNKGQGGTLEPQQTTVHAVLTFFFGAVFLAGGVGTYLVVVFTNGFTFNFAQPIWDALKVRIYFANIAVSVLVSLGVGFILATFFTPVLAQTGMDPGTAGVLPVMVIMGIFLMAKLWVSVFCPVERRAITRRLQAQGITPEQLQGAVLVGLSNPASGFAKRFAAIEEDIGALWVGPDQLLYYGDKERFSIGREQLIQIERRADNRSTSVLGGIAHVVLHVRLTDGGERQIRLHIEGVWTMGKARRVMDALGESIVRWYESAAPVAAA